MRMFILGAGASKCAGLPLMGEFLPGLVRFLDSEAYGAHPDPDPEEFRRILDGMVRESYPTWRHGDYAALDLEEVLSLIDFTAELFAMGKQLAWLDDWNRLHLREVIARYLWHLIDASPANNRIRSFVLDELQPSDVVVTFNWDTLIEKYLLERNVTPTHGHKSSQDFRLLKLHGSINWLQLPDGVSPHRSNPMTPLSPVNRVWLDPTLAGTTPYLALHEAPLIIAPRYGKRFSDAILGQWVLAMAAANHVSRVYVIGYSFPKTDLQSGVLLSQIGQSLRRSRRGGVVVVNRSMNQALRDRFTQHLGECVRFEEAAFEMWKPST